LAGMSSWYDTLAPVRSLGSVHEGRGTLGGLHADRQEHLGQFFTPAPLVRWIWDLVEPAFGAALARSRAGARIAIMDNACGTGRLLQFADPALHFIGGCDVHAPSVGLLATAAQAAGFACDFHVAGMEDVHARNFSAALINPPFSLHLESPHMVGYGVCAHGRFGPGTSCLSHAYAVAQALDAANLVAAILPTTFAETLPAQPSFRSRLRLIAALPRDAFEEEGVDVDVSVAIWDAAPAGADCQRWRVQSLSEPPPALELLCGTTSENGEPRLTVQGIDPSLPSITLPVTGDRTVRVVHNGRKILLGFRCGLIEAKVRNAILGDRLDWVRCREEGRAPTEIEFTGQGVLDLEVHLAQDDPVQSFGAFLRAIRGAGGRPEVDPGILGFLGRHSRRMCRHRVPFGLVVKQPSVAAAAGRIAATCRATFNTDPTRWGSPVIAAGTRVTALRLPDGLFRVEHGKGRWECSAEEFNARFATASSSGYQWIEKFPGRAKTFPELARQWRSRAAALGIDRWLWPYQFDDLVEFALSPYGAIAAWEMGLGKARLAIALCMLHGGPRNLVVVQAHLVDEMKTELGKVGVPAGEWQVIDTAGQCDQLRRINVISYARLRMPVAAGAGRRTYARLLRRRFSVVVADEGHLLRNQDTEQTRALWMLSSRRAVILSGTPLPNYPRNLLAQIAWVYGDGTAAQPIGLRRAYLDPTLRQSARAARRGVDHFRDQYVVLEWCTNEFAEQMSQGAKREVPKIKNLAAYRAMIAPLVKRRVAQEPEVAAVVTIPTPTEEVLTAEWDEPHLRHYLEVSAEFRQWFMEARTAAGQRRQNVNLIALLARIGAVESALNTPERGSKHVGCYRGGLTSKQRLAIERCVRHAADGHKTILFVRSPASAELFARELRARGIECAVLHGGISQPERTRALRDDFRLGEAPVLVATLGTSETGLNIPEADRIVFYVRDWTAKTERQAKARVLRPQQKRPVHVEYLCLPGSLDIYMAQMVAFKGNAADAGLDWASPEFDDEEFIHLDSILGRYCEAVAALLGCKAGELRERLAAA
jgi:hypothetical protein